MNLNFNFNAKTLLSKWWTIVRDNFKEIETGMTQLGSRIDEESKKLEDETKEREKVFAALGTSITKEISDRKAADEELGKLIDAEVGNRQNGDEELQNQINAEAGNRREADEALGTRITEAVTQFTKDLDAEIGNRQNGDEELQNNINAEANSRREADTALDERLSAVEQKAHTHENMEILDGIDAERVRKWDEGSEGQITLGEYLEHLAEAERQFGMLWGLLGMAVYDGGWFGMEQIDIPLDGGLFEDTVFTPLDCGGFEPYVISSGGGVGTVVDGGTY